jgi:glyoxylase-like metal-dependent hydrolase (beta-lactamase superfamily II)
MRVHHLDCGTMCPGAARWVPGFPLSPPRMVCHCLLIESAQGLVLVETGIGLDDIARPARLGKIFRVAAGPRLARDQTAAVQVERLGYARSDVRHIVLTHGHLDHLGGIADFPDASVHLYAPEYAAMRELPTRVERRVYKQVQWAHGPRWAPHALEGDRFFGFDAVRPLAGIEPEILLVPLPGHTRGHAGVAVRGERGWLLHAGDLYTHRDQLGPAPTSGPLGLRIFQRFNDLDTTLRLHNLARLRALKADHAEQVEIFCAHDAAEYDALAAR